ncbi:MAG: Rne/Rng family ribonuclease, partial [Acidobacteriota bacterium]
MTKELYVSSSPHETKVAVLEDDQLVEVWFERDVDIGIVGAIYKGRVSRVLPGMQSAFVDVGLERDAFLYVSDFYEESEEYERLGSNGEAGKREAKGRSKEAPPEAPAPETAVAVADAPEPPSPEPSGDAQASTENVPSAAEPSSSAAEPSPSAAEPSPSAAKPSPSVAPARDEQEGGFRRRGRPSRRRRIDSRRGSSGFRKEEKTERPGKVDDKDFQLLPGETLALHRDEPRADSQQGPENGSPTSIAEGHSTSHTQGIPDAASPAEEPLDRNLPTLDTDKKDSAGSLVPEGYLTGSEPEVPLAGELPESWFTRRDSEPEAPDSEQESKISAETASESESDGGRNPSDEPAQVDEDSTSASGDDASGDQPPEPKNRKRKYTLRDSDGQARFSATSRGSGTGTRKPRRTAPRRPVRRSRSQSSSSPQVQIANVLKEGQEILVQIAREPLGTKGARITSHIALPGRYLVYMPTVAHIGVSRKISSEEQRLRLRNTILEHKGSLTGGFIARTAAEGRSEDDIKADIDFLTKLWNELRTRADAAKAPALIHRDAGLVERVLRDIFSPDFKRIRVDSEAEFEGAVDFVNRSQPSLVGRVKLYDRETPIFEEFGIQAEIEKALKSKIWLKSGGYIVINETEALVAIDVNTGKFVGRTNRLEDTILRTNVDATKEIVRQMRLRDLGGIIVIDFIDMDERRSRTKVLQALEDALKADRAPSKALSFNDFGLVAITRKRVRQSLGRTLCHPCIYC